MKTRDITKHATQAGFTLIEMLAVILILSILMGVLVTSLMSAEDKAFKKLTSARISNIEAALGNYEGDMDDFPLSHFGDATTSSAAKVNQGSEALVQALWKAPFDGKGLTDDMLGNTDGDSANNEPLFELLDLWGNPIAYFHRTDYKTIQTYLTFDGETGEEIEGEVVARKHPVTGKWANRMKFQLISAGVDGRFGTGDDIGNFKMPDAPSATEDE
jgi:prepilin-type N-terminal cleavage/methylation domain-containing protein